MMRFFRDLRIIPIALIASGCLLVLKTADLMLDGGSWLAGDNAPAGDASSVIRTTPDVVQQSGSARSWAREMFNFPDGGNGATPLRAVARTTSDKSNQDITGSVTAPPADREGKGEALAKAEPAAAAGSDSKSGADAKGAKDAKDAKDPKGSKSAKPQNGIVIPLEGAALPSGAERALLERLTERRQELDTRARELDIRESLIKAAEKRMDARLAELKETEERVKVETEQKSEAEAARFKSLVTMYENMKPRDAAKIFDRLEIGVLIEVASKINPRRMSDILAQMSPDTAEHLTVELASKAQQNAKTGAAPELPKIQGRPTTP